MIECCCCSDALHYYCAGLISESLLEKGLWQFRGWQVYQTRKAITVLDVTVVRIVPKFAASL